MPNQPIATEGVEPGLPVEPGISGPKGSAVSAGAARQSEGPLPLQFSLRSLLLAVAGCSVLFAVVTILDTLWAAMIVLTAVLLLAHVAAAAIGMRVSAGARGQADRRHGALPLNARHEAKRPSRSLREPN